MPKNKKLIIGFALALTILFAILSIALAVSLFSGGTALANSLKYYIGQNKVLAALIFIGLAALSAILPPLATITFLPPVLLVWPKDVIVIFTMIGWLIGGIIGYTIFRFVARPVLEKFFSFEKIDFFVASLPKNLNLGLALLFRLVAPGEIATYTLGLIKYPFGYFLLVTLLGELPSALTYIYGAHEFLSKQIGWSILIFSLGFLLLLMLIVLFAKKFKEKTGQLPFKNSWLEFSFLAWENWKNTAALFPTSKFVAKKIAKLAKGKYLVEYGSGSGAITRELLKVLPPEGKLLCAELNPAFCQKLKEIKDERLIVINQNAAEINLNDYLKEVETIVASLPFSYMKKEEIKKIIENGKKALKQNGIFIFTQENPFLLKTLRSYFKEIKISFELRNIPPRFIILGKN